MMTWPPAASGPERRRGWESRQQGRWGQASLSTSLRTWPKGREGAGQGPQERNVCRPAEATIQGNRHLSHGEPPGGLSPAIPADLDSVHPGGGMWSSRRAGHTGSDPAGPVLSPLLPKHKAEDAPWAMAAAKAPLVWETPGPSTCVDNRAPRGPTTPGPNCLGPQAPWWRAGTRAGAWVAPNPGLPLSALSTFQLISETITKATFCLLLTSEGRPFLPSMWEMYSIDGKAQCRPMSCRQPNIQHSGNDYPVSRPGSRTAVPGSRSPGLRQVRDRGGCCCQAPVWLRQSCRIRLSYERNNAPGAAQGLPGHRLG